METGQLPVQSRRENINVSQSINVFAQYESTKFQWSPSYIYSQSFWVNCKRVEIERKRNDQSNAKHHHSSCAYIISHIMNAYSTITQPPVTHTHLQHAIVRSHMQYCELLIGQPRSSQEPEISLAPRGDEIPSPSPALPPDGECHARRVLHTVLGGAPSATLTAGHPHHQQPPCDWPLLLAHDEERHALLPRRLHYRRPPLLPLHQGKLDTYLYNQDASKALFFFLVNARVFSIHVRTRWNLLYISTKFKFVKYCKICKFQLGAETSLEQLGLIPPKPPCIFWKKNQYLC